MAYISTSRSKWKGIFSKIRYDLVYRVYDIRTKQRECWKKSMWDVRHMNSYSNFFKKTRDRASVILPENIGQRTFTYSGQRIGGVTATSDHIGFNLGEFSHTTKRGSRIHTNNAKTRKSKSKK